MTGLGMDSGWVPISPLPVSYPCFKIEENPNLIKVGKTCQIGFGSDGYPRICVCCGAY